MIIIFILDCVKLKIYLNFLGKVNYKILENLKYIISNKNINLTKLAMK
jgi:hypothetical protein